MLYSVGWSGITQPAKPELAIQSHPPGGLRYAAGRLRSDRARSGFEPEDCSADPIGSPWQTKIGSLKAGRENRFYSDHVIDS